MLENQQRWYREYDHSGNQIYHFRQTGRGEEWLNSSLSELEYFADGNLKFQKSKNADSDGNWDRGYFNHYDNYVNGTFTTYLPAGSHIVRITGGDEVVVKRLLVE